MRPECKQRYVAEPIRGKSVPLLFEYLRCNVLRRAAHAEGLDVVILREYLGDAKISDLHMSIFVHKYVLRFEVAIHDVLGM